MADLPKSKLVISDQAMKDLQRRQRSNGEHPFSSKAVSQRAAEKLQRAKSRLS